MRNWRRFVGAACKRAWKFAKYNSEMRHFVHLQDYILSILFSGSSSQFQSPEGASSPLWRTTFLEIMCFEISDFQTNVSLSCPSRFRSSTPSLVPLRVLVNTTNPPAIKHQHERAAVPLFWHFSPVLCLCSSFSSRAPFVSRSVAFPLRFRALFLSLFFFFFAKLPLVCMYASSLYGSRPRWCNTE